MIVARSRVLKAGRNLYDNILFFADDIYPVMVYKTKYSHLWRYLLGMI